MGEPQKNGSKYSYYYLEIMQGFNKGAGKKE